MKYEIIENYHNNEILRNEFHIFISKIFPSISFKEWTTKGFWTEKYNPFSIIKSDKIVSNISAAYMDIIINGNKRKAVQLGAIGTLPEYRELGLARNLMDYILKKYKDKVDFIFLFTNESAVKFYPKFGFKYVDQSLFISTSNIPKPEFSARKLNIDVESDYLLLRNLIKNRIALTKIFGAKDYEYITMWHILNLYRNDLYYLKEENVIIIKKEKNDILQIIDVIFTRPFNFQTVLAKLIKSESLKRIEYCFPPDQLDFKCDEVLGDDTGLFVLGELDLDNKAFRLPETAVT
jgi:Acetyltransferase (GNAT) domain